MILDIRTVIEGHSTLSRTTELESLKEDLPSFSEKIQCRAEIDRTGSTIYVHVWFEGTFELECARCLNPFQYPVSGEFRIVIKEQAGKSNEDLEEDADLVDFYFDTRNEHVDISSAIYDEIMTNIPLMPLCSEECRGIELSTGSAQDESSSQEEEIDPRWEALKKLTKEKKGL